MNYKEAIRYLNSFIDYEKIGYKSRHAFNLKRMRRLAEIFDNPEGKFSSIHIAGTKGKGSIAAFISCILKVMGFTVGTYTSPHLVDARERIKINDELIAKEDLAFCASEIKSKLEKENIGFSPTFFEIYTLLALNYFEAKKIDYGVIETGMGGRLDATNIVRPLVSVISPISYDHIRILGNSLEKIAIEKSGIIKKGCVLVGAPQKNSVLKIIQKKCKVLGVELILVGKDISFREVSHDSEKEVFNVKGILGSYEGCISRLPGRHQIVNAACAVGAVESLVKTTFRGQGKFYSWAPPPGVDPPTSRISPGLGRWFGNSIKKGLERTKNPGRCEVVRRNPYVILDGAQNRASAKALKETIKRNFSYKRLILVLGISKEKDIKGVCEEFVTIADEVILTKANIERREEPAAIAKFIKDKDVILATSVKEALDKARTLAGADDIILITGSFFVIGEAKKIA